MITNLPSEKVTHIMPTKDANFFRYHRLERESQYSELQFKHKEPPVPLKAILIALIMFIAGSIMIILGALLFTGYINNKVNHFLFYSYLKGNIFHQMITIIEVKVSRILFINAFEFYLFREFLEKRFKAQK
jgi:hypothetical protein